MIKLSGKIVYAYIYLVNNNIHVQPYLFEICLSDNTNEIGTEPRHFCQSLCGVSRDRMEDTMNSVLSPTRSELPDLFKTGPFIKYKPRHFCQGLCGVSRDRTGDTRIFSPFPDPVGMTGTFKNRTCYKT